MFDKRFFRTETFQDLAHLKRRARAFERFHNSHHRYSVLKGVTSDEHEKRLGFEARLLERGFAPPTSLPRRGLIEFVRLIRSNRELRILGSKFPMPAEFVHRYVTAVLHLRTQRLVVECEGHPWRAEFAFSLN